LRPKACNKQTEKKEREKKCWGGGFGAAGRKRAKNNKKQRRPQISARRIKRKRDKANAAVG